MSISTQLWICVNIVHLAHFCAALHWMINTLLLIWMTNIRLLITRSIRWVQKNPVFYISFVWKTSGLITVIMILRAGRSFVLIRVKTESVWSCFQAQMKEVVTHYLSISLQTHSLFCSSVTSFDWISSIEPAADPHTHTVIIQALYLNTVKDSRRDFCSNKCSFGD